jgi:NAD(P)H-hydrate repair Nnr-like enzyme with NAD(P)H-hydrate dehydratase domain
MLGAALSVTRYLKLDPPRAVLAGDIGRGDGTRAIYESLVESVACQAPDVLALHYCLPVMGLMRRLAEAIGRLAQRPVLIADAGAMYAAKAAGLAPGFDIFTPDAAELAFLADPAASHPAYVARHLFDADVSRAPDLAQTAHRQGNAARLLLVKGETDYVVREGRVLATIEEPDVPPLEAIGGTGDTITGLVAAFVEAGLEHHQAAIIAARANRTAGLMAGATPAASVWEIVRQFPQVFAEHLCEWSEVCSVPPNEAIDSHDYRSHRQEDDTLSPMQEVESD